MRTIKLTIAYDGTNYVGWQVQPNGVAVQELVQR
ncbi:MAG: tRNA pseudouridine(38-40) synthase TruA, partial [bacterium]